MMEQVSPLHDGQPAARLAGWLTLERVSYGGIALIALGVRLWGLGWVALGPEEAAQALPAVAAAAGQAHDLTGVSPFMYTLQRALFLVFGATDASARWWPAFLGGLSPLLFYALRRRLTRGGALAAAALWAVSPVAVWSGRLAVGDALAPTFALAWLAAVVWALDSGMHSFGRHALVPAAVALGLLLSTGRVAYTAVLIGVVGLFWWPSASRRLLGEAQAHWRTILVGLLAAIGLGSTFFALTPAGLASVGDLLGAWLAGVVPGGGTYSVWEQLRRLLVSEPLLLGFGVVGLIWSARCGDRFGEWAGIASALAMLAALAGRGRQPLDLALVTLWLALLAGPAVARVLRVAWPWRREVDSWLLVGLSLALLVSTALSLPAAFTQANSLPWRQVYTGVGIATASIATLIWIAYGAYGNWGTVTRALPIIPLILALAWSLGQMVSVSFDRGAWRQSGMTHTTVAASAEDFREALRQLSALQGGGARETAIDLVWPSRPDDPLLPVVRWHLHDFPYLRISASVQADPAPLVVTPVEDQPRLSERYGGSEFTLLHRWRSESLDGFNANLRWVLYREAQTPPEAFGVLLWVDRTSK